MPKRTKAARIRTLYAKGNKTTRQIADIVGCETSYVRVCARQRVPGGHNAGREYKRRMYALGDKTAARSAWRARYAQLRAVGVGFRAANNAASGFYFRTMIRTGMARRHEANP